MSTGGIVAIVIVAIAIVALAAWLITEQRRRRLRQRYGPEYDRLVEERGSRRAAEAELIQRQRQIAQLDIHPLSAEERDRYSAQWTAVQKDFVERPREALMAATGLVTAVLRDRGYPTDDYGEILAGLSVDHTRTIEEFRKAHGISAGAYSSSVSTEDLRQAMICYRAVFQDVADIPADGANGRPNLGQPDGQAGAGAPERAAAETPEQRGAGATNEPSTGAAMVAGEQAAQQNGAPQGSPRR